MRRSTFARLTLAAGFAALPLAANAAAPVRPVASPPAASPPAVAPTPVGTPPPPPPPALPSPALLPAGRVPVSGHPFASAFSADGEALFVALDVDFGGGIAVLARAGDRYAFSRFVGVRGTPGGLALTRDGATLVVTTGSGLALLDAKALTAGTDAQPRYIDDSANDGSIDVVVSAAGIAYFTNENTGTLGVADLAGQRVIGHVTLDSGPVGLALSADGGSLFVTSEVAKTTVSTRTCAALAGATVREGTLSLVDTAAAVANPSHAVRARAAAGCSPSRIVLSPGGDVAWVSARDDNDVLAFDAAHFATLASNVPFTIETGNAPIGLALLDSGRVLAVANSNRYVADAVTSTLGLIDVRAAFTGGTSTLASLETGGFPRDLTVSPDGKRLALTDYRTNDILFFEIATP